MGTQALLLAALAFALLLAGPLCAALALRLGVVGTVLAAYVLSFAEVVLGAEVLSPFHAAGASGFLAVQGIVATVAATVWFHRGRPRPALPQIAPTALRAHPILVALGAVVAAGLAFQLFLALAAPPNNWDALAYHLSRAAGWYQHGSIGFFDSHTVRENTYLGNAEIQILFSMVFTHGDRLASLPQFIGELVILVSIFGIARRLGFRRSEAAFASLVFATLSEVVLESTTAQNDLVMTAPLIAAAYLILGSSRREHALAAISVGVGLGTKYTAVYAIPLLLVLALSVLPRRRVVELAAASIAAFALFGAAVYGQNELHYGTPLGSTADRAAFTPAITPGNVASTTARTLYRFADLSGLQVGPPGGSSGSFSLQLNHTANEDISYFGPLGALLLLPLAAGYLGLFVLRRTSRARAVFALALPLVAVEIAFTYKYNAWLGRFMILPVAFAAVLVARTYSVRVVSAVASVLGVAFMFLALAHDVRKPVTAPAIWTMPRLQGEAYSLTDPTTFETLDRLVPANGRLGTVLGDDDWDYPLYGPHLTRRLVVLPSRDPFAAAKTDGLEWLVIGDVRVKTNPSWTTARVGPWLLAAPPHTGAARRLAAYDRSQDAL